MKKTLTKIVVFVLTVVLALSFTGCSKALSAYEIACEEGFTGTKQEWLESLKGDTGAAGKDGTNAALSADDINSLYEKAKEEGYSGTYLEFLKEYLGGNDCSAMINQALLQVVKVSSVFYVSTGFYSEKQQTTLNGAGVFYSVDRANGSAYVITNYHVVYYKNATTSNKISNEIYLYLYGGEYEGGKIIATYVGGSMTYDIAVLKVENSEVIKQSSATAVTFANTDYVKVGTQVAAVGNPENDGISASYGIVSKDSEYVNMTGADDVTSVQYRCIRVDCAINHGNSGGGLFAADGMLLGIVNAKIVEEDVENMGYAIPANIAKRVAENIMWNAEKNGKECVSKAIMGVTTYIASSSAVYDNTLGGARIVEKVEVKSVTENSLAANAGVKAGDVVKSLSIDGTSYEVTRLFHVIDAMFCVRPNTEITMVLDRLGTEVTVKFTVTAKDFSDIK